MKTTEEYRVPPYQLRSIMPRLRLAAALPPYNYYRCIHSPTAVVLVLNTSQQIEYCSYAVFGRLVFHDNLIQQSPIVVCALGIHLLL